MYFEKTYYNRRALDSQPLLLFMTVKSTLLCTKYGSLITEAYCVHEYIYINNKVKMYSIFGKYIFTYCIKIRFYCEIFCSTI